MPDARNVTSTSRFISDFLPIIDSCRGGRGSVLSRKVRARRAAQSLDSHALGETIMRTRRRTASPSPSPTDCVTLTSRRHINPQPKFTSTAAAADYH